MARKKKSIADKKKTQIKTYINYLKKLNAFHDYASVNYTRAAHLENKTLSQLKEENKELRKKYNKAKNPNSAFRILQNELQREAKYLTRKGLPHARELAWLDSWRKVAEKNGAEKIVENIDLHGVKYIKFLSKNGYTLFDICLLKQNATGDSFETENLDEDVPRETKYLKDLAEKDPVETLKNQKKDAAEKIKAIETEIKEYENERKVAVKPTRSPKPVYRYNKKTQTFTPVYVVSEDGTVRQKYK